MAQYQWGEQTQLGPDYTSVPPPRSGHRWAYHCCVEHEALARQILVDRPPLFERDFEVARPQLEHAFQGRTVLVVGAGGSIGRATAELLLDLRPSRTLLVDISENNLVAITRRLRMRYGAAGPQFEAWPLDFCGAPFEAFLHRERPEVILNFAAFKHVRSEKDVLTLAEMVRVNVVGNRKLLDWASHNGVRRVFAISTDKAAGPVSCMGATKRVMELLLWCHVALNGPVVTSTRFANVLFSDGSLPASFLERMAERQPLVGPNDVERFFISPAEAARLCLLAASHPQSGEFLVPNMGPEAQIRFDVIAERLLTARGFQPRHYSNFTTARDALESDVSAGFWPCVFGASTTSGEKDAEEFTEPDEQFSAMQPYRELTSIQGRAHLPTDELKRSVTDAEGWISDANWLRTNSKSAMVNWLKGLVPSLEHIETGENLDRKI
jgi:nucleoside-diphosphate-sugar epimerase